MLQHLYEYRDTEWWGGYSGSAGRHGAQLQREFLVYGPNSTQHLNRWQKYW